MPTEKESPISAAEFKTLFSGLENIPNLILAVSGGPDSTALMLLAARWRKGLKKKPALLAVTVDHGLRKEAKGEAAVVARLARNLGVAHRSLRWTGRKPKTGLQQAARQARYRLLAEAARKTGVSHVVTAHTLDDQAETVLIRMSRGSGIGGLGAMSRVAPLPYPSPEMGGSIAPSTIGVGSPSSELSPTRRAEPVMRPAQAGRTHWLPDLPLGGGKIIWVVRPLLDIPKARLVATLRAAKIPFVDDPSNRDPRFARARLRSLMPQLAQEGLDVRRLAVLARRLKRADAAIEAAVNEADRALVVETANPGGLVIEARRFAGLSGEVALRLLGRAIARLGDEGPVELGKLESLQAALEAAQKGGNSFRRSLAGALVTLAGVQIAVQRAPPRRRKALTKRRGDRAGMAKSR